MERGDCMSGKKERWLQMNQWGTVHEYCVFIATYIKNSTKSIWKDMTPLCFYMNIVFAQFRLFTTNQQCCKVNKYKWVLRHLDLNTSVFWYFYSTTFMITLLTLWIYVKKIKYQQINSNVLWPDLIEPYDKLTSCPAIYKIIKMSPTFISCNIKLTDNYSLILWYTVLCRTFRHLFRFLSIMQHRQRGVWSVPD